MGPWGDDASQVASCPSASIELRDEGAPASLPTNRKLRRPRATGLIRCSVRLLCLPCQCALSLRMKIPPGDLAPGETARSGAGNDKCAAFSRRPRSAAALCQEFAHLAEVHIPTFPSRPMVYPGKLNSPHRGCPAYLMTTDSKSCLLGWSF